MFIRTERLFLRPGWPEDLDDLLEALSDEAVQRTAAFSPPPPTRQGAHDYLGGAVDPRFPRFCMYLRSAPGAKLVGGIGLARRGDEVELGYWIAAAHRGRGYAAEAVRAMVEYARALGHRRLIVKHLARDDASVSVLEAAGFRGDTSQSAPHRAAIGGESPPRIFVADLVRRDNVIKQRPEMLGA